MKNHLIALLLLFICTEVNGQRRADSNHFNEHHLSFTVGFGYSSGNFMSVYGVAGIPISGYSHLLFGIDVTSNLEIAGVGRDYSYTLSRHTYPNEIYSVSAHKLDAMSFLGGMMLTKKSGVLGKIGSGRSGLFHNAFDNSYILSNTGYYYIMETLPNELVYGVSAFFLYRPVSVILGWDNFSGASAGIGIAF
jgi:hypothetical protein